MMDLKRRIKTILLADFAAAMWLTLKYFFRPSRISGS